MRVLITGSSGFIGRELVKHLSDRQYEIAPYDIKNGQDILNYDRLRQDMSGCTTVIHLAAIPKPMEDKTWEEYQAINVNGTENVAQAALETNVRRLIYASSTSYYGLERDVPIPPLPITESTLPLTQRVKVEELECRACDIAYSTSKVMAEQVLANYGLTQRLEIFMLRLGPTRKRGELRPFGELEINLKMEHALQALELAINAEAVWYEAFTITDQNPNVDLSKARKLLGYHPA